ncbi:MAG: hypothetical protein AABX02_04875 [archaeon]
MVYIKTTFYPYRLVLTRREPVQLTLDLRNDGKEERAYSIELSVGSPLALERAGAKVNDRRQVGSLLPGQSKVVYYDIFAKAATDAESIPIDLRVHELPKNAKGIHDIIQTFSRTLDLTVQNR